MIILKYRSRKLNSAKLVRIRMIYAKLASTTFFKFSLRESAEFRVRAQKCRFSLKIKLFYFTLLDLLRARLTQFDHSTQTQDAIFAFDVF